MYTVPGTRTRMASPWTAERRQRQAALIPTWRPWQHATGPRTTEGKERSARNAYRGGYRPMLRDLARALREQEWLLDDL